MRTATCSNGLRKKIPLMTAVKKGICFFKTVSVHRLFMRFRSTARKRNRQYSSRLSFSADKSLAISAAFILLPRESQVRKDISIVSVRQNSIVKSKRIAFWRTIHCNFFIVVIIISTNLRKRNGKGSFRIF